MKRFLIVLLSGILTLSVTAQTITITFNGANRNKNYQVVLDGTSYYSNAQTDPNSTTTNVRKEITLTNQQLGLHTIAVYRLRTSSGAYINGTNTPAYGNAIYSNRFRLREGYNMDITVNGNGRIMFSEKSISNEPEEDDEQNILPMADAAFDQLLQSVRSKYLQSSKITVIKNALGNTANYFTTEQVSQLLSLITTEANKLMLAKLAYPRVTDPSNFTELYEVFTTEASKNEMNIFIRNNPNTNNTANNNKAKTPMGSYQFSQLLQTINSQYSQSTKYSTIVGAFSNSANYFTTAQVRQLLSVINSEIDRLALAKQSYLKVTDPTNFTSLYDLFYTQAYRNDLNNYVIQNGGSGTYTNTQATTRIAMDDAAFTQVLRKVSNHFLPWDKVRDARDAFNNTSYYFSTSQIRQILTVISSENDRLDLAKLAWSRVTDPTYFTQLFDMFTSQANRDALNAYILAHPY